jgi:hypothetical protein
MAVQINTYTGLSAGFLAWLVREGDTRLSDRFDDFLAMCEQRMYYGYATEDVGNPLRSDPLRIPEMEVVDPAFSLTGDPDVDSARLVESDTVRVTEDATDPAVELSGTVAQPTAFLELISALNNSDSLPIEIVSQRIIDGYGTAALGRTAGMMAVSGTNFRFFDAPSSGTATLRYYQKLTTPSAASANDILTNYPNVYLYGCLTEAAIFSQGADEAQRYLQLYNASVAGLNARTQRITASSVPRIRLRAGMTP